jgi:hypothetical protein
VHSTWYVDVIVLVTVLVTVDMTDSETAVAVVEAIVFAAETFIFS